jgi:hypothetical protein
MSAVFSLSNDQVLVQVDGALGYGVWTTLRDARNAAKANALPLCVDVRQCTVGDMAGIGSLMLAQERLPAVKLKGCHDVFVECFEAFGICKHCAQDAEQPLGCPKRSAH